VIDRVYLRAAGVGVLLDLRDADVRLAHWGADLGELVPDAVALEPSVPHSASDDPVPVSLIPQASRGWRGTPGVSGDRDSRSYSLRLVLQDVEASESSAVLTLSDEAAGIRVRSALSLEPSGLLLIDQELQNVGDGAFRVASLDVTLPVPSHATEALDLTGRWAREKHPQRRRIDQGTWVRTGRHGRTGHDSTLVIAAGSPGFGWGSGEVWAVHLGWSGDHTSRVERSGDGQKVLAVGELLHSGELVLAPGETYHAPRAFACYSSHGLDGVSASFHEWMRARPTHPDSPRPVVLNTWEAVYFNHDLTVLRQLADAAAELGVERFVLDDGWFVGRRDDTAGLGDWFVDPDVWPQGLTPLIEHVRSRGMQFGLWVEPEMINEDSNLARLHPDWISGPGDRRSLRWRHQQVLDLVNPDAWDYIYARLDALLSEYPIAYLKWDQNRDQLELGHDGRSSTHEQTLAAYRMFDALRAAHPDVEIESCSSGGARVDLGILQRTDRVWASDTNDALERQTIQRWTGLVLPPELVGSHVGPGTSHTTGRTHALSFRVITALFGHFGVEWDVRALTDGERKELGEAIGFYKAHRQLIHSGRAVRIDRPDDTDSAYGVIAQDGSRALVAYVTLATSPDEASGRLRVPGLDPDALYRVSLALPLDRHSFGGRALPAWMREGRAAMSGRALDVIGLAMPVLHPERALLLELVAQP
jgi:alpha-galactosidase